MDSPQEHDETSLPTLDRLGVTISPNLDARQVVVEWFTAFGSLMKTGDASAVCSLFVEDAFWRDLLALTWDFRTFSGLPTIQQFLSDRLQAIHATAFQLMPDTIGLQRPFPDLVWISFLFNFETDIGLASGVGRLIPTPDKTWKAHCVFTNLEALKGFPEKVGNLRDHTANYAKWVEDRHRESSFADMDPEVLIIGGGHNGLGLAARLKVLEVPTLVIEKWPRIGDNWRNRYEALNLHGTVWFDQMPYLPFPLTWPVHTPASKLANWLEYYVEALDLNVWTSATVIRVSQHESNKWSVTVKQSDGCERLLTVSHVVFATGFGSEEGPVPSYIGMDSFKGEILHSSRYKKAENYSGKKIVIIGAGTSAHDIAADCYEYGLDVTMFQRSSIYIMSIEKGMKVLLGGLYSETGPPVDIADRLNASFPTKFGIGMAQRATKRIAELDKDLLDGLRSRGFKLNMGQQGTGFSLLARSSKLGGYHLDGGASQLIVDGKIKLKSDSLINSFTENGLKFEDGSELPADVIIFATGLCDFRSRMEDLCGEEVMKKCKPLWGLNEEGEINGVWRDIGVPGLWCMLGNLALGRFYSKHIALQIKAIQEGIFGTRYCEK